MLTLDHVVYAVADLDDAARTWRRTYGLGSVEGGRHDRWGTENGIVPLGTSYVELIAAFDPALAERTAFGRSVLEVGASGGGWVMPVLATDDLDAVATRLGLEVIEGVRRRPDGAVLRWRSAGFDDPRRAPSMPFFIAWDVPGSLHPSAVRAGHATGATGIANVELAGPLEVLEAWIGDQRPSELTLVDGPPALRTVTIATADGDLRID